MHCKSCVSNSQITFSLEFPIDRSTKIVSFVKKVVFAICISLLDVACQVLIILLQVGVHFAVNHTSLPSALRNRLTFSFTLQHFQQLLYTLVPGLKSLLLCLYSHLQFLLKAKRKEGKVCNFQKCLTLKKVVVKVSLLKAIK